jgi:uncharacterized protein (TIGR00725 family)
VIGSGDATAEQSRLAEDVGRLSAQRGAIVVCGGLGGVMEAACRGAKQAAPDRLTTVGILPGADPASANRYVDIPVVTGLGDARNVIVVSTADAVIAVGGGVGTLSEIAFALRRSKPVIVLGSWRLDGKRCPADARLLEATSAQEAVEKAFALV